jgi:hypothetical protein
MLHKFVEGNGEVFIKYYNMNRWTWLPAVIVKRCGLVKYVVKAETHTGTLNMKVHFKRIKHRFADEDSNSNSDLSMVNTMTSEAKEVNETLYGKAEHEQEKLKRQRFQHIQRESKFPPACSTYFESAQPST